MFSRLSRPAARLALPRALGLKPLAASFSTAPIPPSSSYPWEKGAYDPSSGYPMPTPTNSGDDHISVIKEYGWRPFVGGLAGLLLFKEVHAVKEESVLACLTLTGFYVAYIALGDKLIEAAEADEAKKRKLLADLSACEMAGLEMYEQKLKLPAHLPPLLEAMSKEHKETAERWVEYKNKQMRANFAAETIAS